MNSMSPLFRDSSAGRALLPKPWIARVLILALSYFVAGRLGLLLPFVGVNVTLIWAPTGISIAALILYGRSLWPGVALGAAWVALAVGSPILTTALVSLGNTLEALLGATLLRSLTSKETFLESPRDLMTFFGLGVLVSPIPSATLGATALCLNGTVPWTDFGALWFPWWLGNCGGALLVLPFLLSWSRIRRQPIRGRRLLEATGITVGLSAIGYLVWGFEIEPAWGLYPLELLPLPFVIWAALRFHMPGATATALLLAFIAVSGSLRGTGPFVQSSTHESLIPLFIYYCTAGVLALLTAIQTERLRTARATAIFASRAKSEFLANMSHEIRTPMNGVIGLARLLSKAELPTRERQFAEQVTQSAESLLRLLDDLIDLTKVESGKLTIEKHSFHIKVMVREVVEILRHRAEAKNISLRLQVAPDMPPSIRSDSTRLRQILTNLVSNAIKFTAEGSVRIRISTLTEPEETTPTSATAETTPQWLYCEVEDSGIGIAEEAQQDLFQPFHQAEASTTRRFGGAGLGLAISKQIVEQMGGSIGLRSAPGAGSTFFFRVPLEIVEKVDPDPTDDPFAESLRRRRRYFRILTVDDEPVNRLVTHNELLGLGYLSATADDGPAALRLLEQGGFDLVLMDCQMPEMDGFETTRELRDREPAGKRIPVVALTASVLEDDRDKCFSAGMDGFVPKPFTVESLAGTLDRFLLGDDGPPPALSSAVIDQILDIPDRPGNTFAELVDAFLSGARIRLRAMREGLDAEDIDAIVSAAHGLRGAAAMIGATSLFKLSAQIEEVADENLVACAEIIQNAEQEFRRVELALQSFERSHS